MSGSFAVFFISYLYIFDIPELFCEREGHAGVPAGGRARAAVPRFFLCAVFRCECIFNAESGTIGVV